MLADAVGHGDRTWRAYLSTTAGGEELEASAPGEPRRVRVRAAMAESAGPDAALFAVMGDSLIRIRGGSTELVTTYPPAATLRRVRGEAPQSVNARDRIGSGPWYNAKGELIALNVADLHGDNPKWTKQTALNEKGEVVNGRGDTPNRHDILTGSQQDGTAFAPGTDTTCSNWTSSAADGSAQVGHFDKTGGGANPNSWNSAHPSRGCGQANLQATGGDGLFYCFAIN
jgi:hypothetical protein